MSNLILTIGSVLKDASQTTITDTTTYSSPARNEYSSVFYAYKVDENEVTTPSIIESQGDPLVSASWVVNTPEDGYYRFKLLLYWNWTAGTNFVVGDLTIYNSVYYRALTINDNVQPDTSIGTDWEVHTASDIDIQLVETGELNCVLFYRIKTCFSKEVALAASIACQCADGKKPAEIQRYERLGVLVDGIAVDNYQLRFGEGEKKVRYAAKLCSNCN